MCWVDLDHQNGPSIDFDREMKISCFSCGSQLGLPENNYHISSTLVSTSKSLLAYESRRANTCSTSIMTENRYKPISVLLTDISFINKRFIKQSKDVWCEQDGCVYRTISCFSCAVDTYLGLQVIAADAQNHHLLNKVFFFLDRLRLKDDEQMEKSSLPENSSTAIEASGWVSIEKFSYQSQTNFRESQTSKSKLKLPRRTVS